MNTSNMKDLSKEDQELLESVKAQKLEHEEKARKVKESEEAIREILTTNNCGLVLYHIQGSDGTDNFEFKVVNKE